MSASSSGSPLPGGPAAAAGPLAGIRVADFSRVLAGPYASMMLADFGAEVIKVESPAGDDTRAWTPPVDEHGVGTYFSSVNRNKRSLVCDLSDAEGLARARQLALQADVVIENFRPGVMRKFGLDYDSLQRPDLIYCSITGFGSTAGAHLPGYDLLVQAVGGLMSVTGSLDSEPSKVGVALVDIVTGQNAAFGILTALRHRDATGRGQLIEVNLLTSLLAGLVNQASSTLATGEAPRRMGNAHPSIAPYETLQTADGPFAVAVGTDRQFAALVRVLGVPALADEPRFCTNTERVAHRDELKALLLEQLGRKPAGEWAALLSAAGVPAGKVNSIAEALQLADELGLDPTVRMAEETGGRTSHQVASPIRLSETPASYRHLPPLLGEHADATFAGSPTPSDADRKHLTP